MATVSGLSAGELGLVRGRLEAFAEDVFESLARSDQRRWGGAYLRGLMLDGRRKSIEPMAARLEDGDEQCLQQFVNQSPWDWRGVRRRLAELMSEQIGPEAWIIDDTGFPKQGRWSVGVARQYCGALGKVGNCQLGVSVNAATDWASCPLDWRLFMPVEWEHDQERRARAHVPETVVHRPKWQLALDMIDELKGWGLRPPLISADAGYGDITEFRQGLEARELRYMLALKGSASAYPADALPERPACKGTGRPASAALPHQAQLAAPARTGRRPDRDGRGQLARRIARPDALAVPRAAESGPRTRGCAAPPHKPTANCPNAGCSPNGPPAARSPSNTGSPTSPPTRRSNNSCASRS